MTKKAIIFLFAALLICGVLLSGALQFLNRLRPVEQDGRNSTTAPQRIICTAPSIIETVYALGEESRIVGVGDFVTYPPEALTIEKIGGLVNPDFERITRLKPDLLIVQGIMQKHEDFCKAKGIPVLRVDMDSLDSIYEGMRSIGVALGCPEKAEDLVRGTMNNLNLIRKQAARLERNPAVFMCLGRSSGSLTGVFTSHPGSFVNELMALAGGVNIFHDIQGRYPQVSKESLLKRNPDIILEFHPGENLTEDSYQPLIDDWKALPSINAVKSDRVHILVDDFILIPGPRITETAKRFFELLHDNHE